MANRTVNIGLIHQAALAGMEASIAIGYGVDVSGYHDHLVYTAMVQSGVQRFRVIGPMAKNISDSGFLSKRCQEYPFEKYVEAMTLVHDLITDNSPLDKVTNTTDPKMVGLRFFLSDLLLALETKSAMVSIFDIPDLTKLSKYLSPGLLAIVSGLMKKIEPVELVSAVPQRQVHSQDVEVFQEIITSDLFARYSDSHNMLDLNSESTSLVVNDIMQKGKTLSSKYSKYLDLKKIPVSLIPMTTAIVDSIFGKIPGTIAETLGKAFVEFVDDNKRITIYDYGDVHARLLLDHYSGLAKLKCIQGDIA